MAAVATALLLAALTAPTPLDAQQTAKPVLHGKHWVAITGKPLGATAGALIFGQGGNAVDAACAMLAATATMWDVLSWGGETQALIFNPNTGKVRVPRRTTTRSRATTSTRRPWGRSPP
jgi:gamma-glutamyltranspeptidase/glutathione hydrolase